MYWQLVTRTDPRARALADRHYSRKSPGAVEFCPAGHNIVLLGRNEDALWVTHRPAPDAPTEYARRRDGFCGWDNPYFRNESGIQSSTLIREALAASLYLWGDFLPPMGIVSFINPRKVQAIKRRGQDFYGYTYLMAGFEHQGYSSERGFWRWVLSGAALAAISPAPPVVEFFGAFVRAARFELVS